MKKVMLLVSEDLCDTLRNTLEDTYITLPCYDPAASKESFQKNPDVLILNLSLPGTDGLTFLKNNAARLPPGIIVLTAFVSETILQELTQLHVDSVIRIPFPISSLKQQLAELCIKKRPSR